MQENIKNAQYFNQKAKEANLKFAEAKATELIKKCIEDIEKEAENGKFYISYEYAELPEFFKSTNYRQDLHRIFKSKMEELGFKITIDEVAENEKNHYLVINY